MNLTFPFSSPKYAASAPYIPFVYPSYPVPYSWYSVTALPLILKLTIFAELSPSNNEIPSSSRVPFSLSISVIFPSSSIEVIISSFLISNTSCCSLSSWEVSVSDTSVFSSWLSGCSLSIVIFLSATSCSSCIISSLFSTSEFSPSANVCWTPIPKSNIIHKQIDINFFTFLFLIIHTPPLAFLPLLPDFIFLLDSLSSRWLYI